jgi:hypothetical protein
MEWAALPLPSKLFCFGPSLSPPSCRYHASAPLVTSRACSAAPLSTEPAAYHYCQRLCPAHLDISTSPQDPRCRPSLHRTSPQLSSLGPSWPTLHCPLLRLSDSHCSRPCGPSSTCDTISGASEGIRALASPSRSLCAPRLECRVSGAHSQLTPQGSALKGHVSSTWRS